MGTKVTGISRRLFRPNLQRVHVTTPNGTHKTVRVCTQCIRSGAVAKKIPQRPLPPAEDTTKVEVAGDPRGVYENLTRRRLKRSRSLGRLLLSEKELTTMTDQLAAILDYMDLLAEVDTEHVEPMAHALDVADVFREDLVCPSLDRQQALANAPHHDAECYLVPAVLGET